MRSKAIRNGLLSAALLGFAGSARAAQENSGKPPKPGSSTASGLKLYNQKCAVCHGNDGKGNGPPPASSPFTEAPPDLTTLTKRHNGAFPAAYVKSVLRNGVGVPDHGPAEMPVWGEVFKVTPKLDEAAVMARIESLANYLKSIQAK